MPIKIQNDLPVKEILEKENLFVVDENRATHQDIRPLQLCILNLMPKKEETELQLLRMLSNTPLQIDITFMRMSSHKSLNTPISHLQKFYYTFEELKDQRFDGLIITGAPVEKMEYEEQDQCIQHLPYLLGSPGRSLLSLRTPKEDAFGETVRRILP